MVEAAAIHTVNLSRAKNVPRNRRARKAVRILKEFVSRHHPEADNILVSTRVNTTLWRNGARRPPNSIQVQVVEQEREDEEDPLTVLVERADIDISALEAEQEPEEAEEAEEPSAKQVEREGALPSSIEDVLKNGTVSEAKDALKGLNRKHFQAALDVEKANKNRKTLVQFIESNMN